MQIKIKSKEAFFFEGGEVGCILVHGFTGSPSEMRYLGEQLHQQGYTVCGVLLSGHGESPEELKKTSWLDWYTSVETAVAEMATSCQQIFLIGMSMGGALSLLGASRLKEPKLVGVVSICAPIYLQDKKSYLTPYAQYFMSYYNKRITNYDQALNEENQRYTYYRVPVKSVADLVNLIREVKDQLQFVELPALIIQSKQDRVVVPESGEYIHQRLGSKENELIWLENSGHLATIDTEREKVAALVADFIKVNGGCKNDD